jgi:hypothetical protein
MDVRPWCVRSGDAQARRAGTSRNSGWQSRRAYDCGLRARNPSVGTAAATRHGHPTMGGEFEDILDEL